jgi:hypothetical protein
MRPSATRRPPAGLTRMAAVAVFTALLGVLASGCAATEPTPFRLSGAFTAERTEADLQEFHALVGPYADDVRILESFPEQFAIDGRESDRCDELAALLRAKAYIATVSDCLAL